MIFWSSFPVTGDCLLKKNRIISSFYLALIVYFEKVGFIIFKYFGKLQKYIDFIIHKMLTK